jgi:hypothetical protein
VFRWKTEVDKSLLLLFYRKEDLSCVTQEVQMHLTLLGAAMGTLFVAVLLGTWLSGLYLLREQPPQGMITGLVHGSVGALTVGLLLLALIRPPETMPHPHPHGTGGASFGWMAFVILAGALLGGLTILVTNLRRKQVSILLVAMHACAGIAGAVIMAAYWTTYASFGR